MLFLSCVCYAFACLFIDALWSPAEKGLTSWRTFVMSNCVFVTIPFGILGQVWYLIVLITSSNGRLIFAHFLTFPSW